MMEMRPADRLAVLEADLVQGPVGVVEVAA